MYMSYCCTDVHSTSCTDLRLFIENDVNTLLYALFQSRETKDVENP